MMLTFERSGRKFSEETDSHFQNVSFLQLGVACVVFANQRKNQAFQMTETIVDTSPSSLLQQGFKSLEGIMKTRYSAALSKSQIRKTKCFLSNTERCVVSSFPLPFSARWLVFSGPRWTWQWEAGWPQWRCWDSFRLLLVVVLLRGNTCSWSGRAQVCSRAGEPPIYVSPPRQRGGNTSHRAGGLTPGGRFFWEMSGAAVWTIWSHWAPATSAGMRSFVMMLCLIAFEM